ncbi:MAG: hypothetical protein FIB01_02945 [Gemmatimonadetes bacterium]|nr:hypothetical protein [Gemmatimonadota bacterium]
MGVKLTFRLTPARLSWLLLAGLLAVFAGERIVPSIGLARWVLTAGGSARVLAATVLRFLAWRRAAGAARTLAGLFFATTAGCALALLGFLLAGVLGKVLGIGAQAEGGRLDTALLVLATILLAVSLVTHLAAQWAAGVDQRRDGETGAIDRLRVTRLAATGATVALAAAFLMLLGYVTSARDATLDLGYFKTASPGGAVIRITERLPGQLRVVFFFPPASEVGDQARGYFRALAAASRNVRVEEHDRLAAPKLAEQFGVTEDGTIVLTNREVTERLTLPASLAEARPRLRQLDETVQQMLMRVARQRRTVYLTVGHGELNDPQSRDALAQQPYGGIEAFRSLFGMLNYQVSDLGVHNGLGQAVPADAALVVVLGPHRPFLDAEPPAAR